MKTLKDVGVVIHSEEYVPKSKVVGVAQDLKKRMDEYRKNNDLWRKPQDTILSEFLDMIDEAFGLGEKKVDNCCFCGEYMGALVKLHQGWCCIPCFNRLMTDELRREQKGVD